MGRSFFIQIGICQLLALSFLAFTADAGDRENASITRLNARQDQAEVLHQGTLTCESSEQNTGAACQLLFQAQETGRIFEITGEKNTAMRLYLDGKRNVVIEGLAQGANLRIHKIKAL